MNSKYLKKKLLHYLTSIPGWHTRKKILVIQSDDWGSIRMQSRETLDLFLKAGYEIDNNPFLKYDSIESSDDLDALFEMLIRIKDSNGSHPIFTANTNTSNPDFDKIEASGFQKYYPELFTKTYESYPGRERCFEIINQGLHDKIFFPQFHGREHLNVSRWMKNLKSGDSNTRFAFRNRMFDISTDHIRLGSNSYMDALRYENEEELKDIKDSLREGLIQFEHAFGYRSLSFTAPRYTWSSNLEAYLKELGILFIQSRSYQNIPLGDDINKFQKAINYTGKKNNYDQIYLTRNVFFEPCASEKIDWPGKALKEIKSAFLWKKPAIICSHRVNYVGSIFEENRSKNLKQLKLLLTTVLKEYPDVEFMDSKSLGDLIIETRASTKVQKSIA